MLAEDKVDVAVRSLRAFLDDRDSPGRPSETRVPAAGRALNCSAGVAAALNRRAIESQSVRLSANS